MSLSSLFRKSVSNSIETINIADHYDVVRDLGTGTYGKVVQCICKESGTEVALKMLPKPAVTLSEFQREFTYSYFLSPHSAIANTYDVCFETFDHYVFVQEKGPSGDLFELIPPNVGLPDIIVKNVMKQLISALEFMHSKRIVHRDVKPENILVFDKNCNKIKLVDFGMTRQSGTMVKKYGACIPYSAPEVSEAVRNERYSVEPSLDVWSSAVLMFCAMTGNFPWKLAHYDDCHYYEFSLWQKRKMVKTPHQWRSFSSRFLRLCRKMFEPKSEKRCSIQEIYKYMDDSWTQHPKSESNDDSLFISYDFKLNNELTATLKSYGVKTKLNPRKREKRVEDWLYSSS